MYITKVQLCDATQLFEFYAVDVTFGGRSGNRYTQRALSGEVMRVMVVFLL